MVVQKIKEIDVKKIKQAQGVMAVFELLGITEEDLVLLKEIPTMKAELEELREFKTQVLNTITNKNEAKKSASEVIMQAYGKPPKEFNPYAK